MDRLDAARFTVYCCFTVFAFLLLGSLGALILSSFFPLAAAAAAEAVEIVLWLIIVWQLLPLHCQLEILLEIEIDNA